MTAIQERLKKMETFFDQKEFIVIDHGTGFIKAGFSGEDLPRCVIPTVVGTHQIQLDPSQLIGAAQQEGQMKTEYAFGNAAFAQRSTHQLHFPIKRGIIEDFKMMEQLWAYIFEQELNIDPKNANILLTDSPMNTKVSYFFIIFVGKQARNGKNYVRGLQSRIFGDHKHCSPLTLLNGEDKRPRSRTW